MTPNLSHVAGLELASEAVKDYTSPEAIQGAIYRLLNQANALMRDSEAQLASWKNTDELDVIQERISAHLSRKAKP